VAGERAGKRAGAQAGAGGPTEAQAAGITARAGAGAPLVSVVIPTHDGGAYLREAVESAAAQTLGDLEILVVDDATKDEASLRAVEAMPSLDARVRLLRMPENAGVAAARNAGIEAARGELVAFLDDDDAWLPQKLEKQVEAMRATGCDVCYTAYAFMDEAGNAIRGAYRVPASIGFEGLLRENVIGCSTAVARREAVGATRMRGEYQHEDYVFWLELLRAGRAAAGVDEPLMRYRVRAGGRSADKRGAALGRWRVYRRFLGLSAPRSLALFAGYAWRGAAKHWGGG